MACKQYFNEDESTRTAVPNSFSSSSYIHISTANRLRIRAIWCAPYLAVRNFSRLSLTASPFSLKLTRSAARFGDRSQSFIDVKPHCIMCQLCAVLVLVLKWPSYVVYDMVSLGIFNSLIIISRCYVANCCVEWTVALNGMREITWISFNKLKGWFLYYGFIIMRTQ